MANTNDTPEQPQKEPRFSQEQYDILRRCSDNLDITEWNQYRQDHPDEQILLEGADLREAHLEGANLSAAHLEGTEFIEAHLEGADLREAHLEGAKLGMAHLEDTNLSEAHLEGAHLHGAHLEGANLIQAHLEGALLNRAHLEGALLNRAHLEGAHLRGAHLERAVLNYAHLEGAELDAAHLEGAALYYADLEGAHLHGAHLEGAHLDAAHLEHAFLPFAHLEGAFLHEAHLKGAALNYAHLEGAYLTRADLRSAVAHAARIDGTTINKECLIDRETDFSLVGLDSARIDPGLKGLLEYNIRRKAWEKWYWEGCDLPSPETVPPLDKVPRWQRYPRQLVRLFWWASDYGRSTKRVIYSFFILSVLFAALYVALAYVAPPGPVLNLLTSEVPRGREAVIVPVPGWLVPFRALYFSIVTMTTLGFGDMYAHPESLVGHVLLTFQVILGYVLLGALVTRLNILFTTGGPTPRFADEIPPRKRKRSLFTPDRDSSS